MAATLTLRAAGNNSGARFVDGGRPGMRHRGIPSGGPVDPGSVRLGNELLEQDIRTCCLEMTLRGGKWELSGRGQLVVTGAGVPWQLDGQPLDRWRVTDIDGAATLTGGFARSGCRAYLCVRGQWTLPRVAQSVEPGLPGTPEPREGFSWEVRSDRRCAARQLSEAEQFSGNGVTLRAVPGPEWNLLDRARQIWMLETVFRVGADSDRQGIRLREETPELRLPTLLSSPVLPGTVQLTPGGPILLGPDAQTVGGYPRVLQVVSELASAFQLRPGEKIKFRVDPSR